MVEWAVAAIRWCGVSGCARRAKYLRLCGTHYERKRKHGNVELQARDHDTDARKRLHDRSAPSGTCRLYTAGARDSPYKRMSYRGKHQMVHRVAWELEHGPIPPGLFICHRCDTPNCIRVEHLFLGTAADNNRDRDEKGRTVKLRGSRTAKAKLNEWQVQEILSKLAAGRTLMSLGEEYGVAWQTISSVKYRRNWRHVQAG